jgi:hypothetical protein
MAEFNVRAMVVVALAAATLFSRSLSPRTLLTLRVKNSAEVKASEVPRLLA